MRTCDGASSFVARGSPVAALTPRRAHVQGAVGRFAAELCCCSRLRRYGCYQYGRARLCGLVEGFLEWKSRDAGFSSRLDAELLCGFGALYLKAFLTSLSQSVCSHGCARRTMVPWRQVPSAETLLIYSVPFSRPDR